MGPSHKFSCFYNLLLQKSAAIQITSQTLSYFILKISKEEIWGTEITPINAVHKLKAL